MSLPTHPDEIIRALASLTDVVTAIHAALEKIHGELAWANNARYTVVEDAPVWEEQAGDPAEPAARLSGPHNPGRGAR